MAGSRSFARGVLVGLALASIPSSLLAAEPSASQLAAARELFSRAEKDEDAEHWADALDKLRRAASVKMTPGIRFHIALCEEKLGQLLTALTDYEGSEAAARAEGNKDVLDVVAAPLATLRSRVPTLTITAPADVKDATVTLDGAPLAAGLLGTPVPVDVGVHTVQAHAEGRPPFAMTLSVFERQAANVEVKMAAPQPSSILQGVVAREAPASAPTASRHTATTAALVTTAGAAALVGFGVASYFVAGGQQSSGAFLCSQMVSCNDLKAGPRTWDALALGSWIAAAGVTAVSIYFWTRTEPTEPPARASLGITPGGLVFRSTF
jgi:hypothetical protein